MEGDADANYAYYALHKLHIRPMEWLTMNHREKVFIMAAIDIKTSKQKEVQEELEKELNKNE